MSRQDIESAWRSIGMPEREIGLADFTTPPDTPRKPMIGSTDVGDVSWVVPTVQAHAPTFAIGTPFHSWQMTAQGKTGYAHKAMVQVAKAMAATGAAAILDPSLIAAAKADLKPAGRPAIPMNARSRGRPAAAHHVETLSGDGTAG